MNTGKKSWNGFAFHRECRYFAHLPTYGFFEEKYIWKSLLMCLKLYTTLTILVARKVAQLHIGFCKYCFESLAIQENTRHFHRVYA